MIKTGREHGKGAPAAADLLVCFPSRTHLRLMPKPIRSPARPPEPNKRLHHLKKSGSAAGLASPLMWAKSNKSFGGGTAELVSEPTSPKVTCSGQIKVRHKAAGPCKSWQSVMEEIEKMHKTNHSRRKNDGRSAKRPGWAETLGLKKEVVQFLTCLRTIRFDFRCFGSFHGGADITSDDDDDDDDGEGDEEEEEAVEAKNDGVDKVVNQSESSRTVFSKWFMVLQEDRNCSDDNNDHKAADVDDDDAPAVPPPNALLLMRCRSAPAKSWLEEREEEEEEEEEAKVVSKRSLRHLMDEDEKKSVVVMKYEYDNDLYDNVAKETWLVGGLTDHLARCRSWKR